ncbi:multidrug resistance-associated protein 5, partial [Tanacetum coccineum]
ESTESWEWFIKSLTKDLGLADGHGITFISDGHKGLIQAVRRVVPRVEHRLCARHIYANFSKVYSGVLFRNLFWQASKASYHQKFKNTMEEIKTASIGAYQYLVDKDPCTWSRAYFKEGMVYGWEEPVLLVQTGEGEVLVVQTGEGEVLVVQIGEGEVLVVQT